MGRRHKGNEAIPDDFVTPFVTLGLLAARRTL
jgi:hypothetical protein